jgi:hypothetical protein
MTTHTGIDIDLTIATLEAVRAELDAMLKASEDARTAFDQIDPRRWGQIRVAKSGIEASIQIFKQSKVEASTK